MGGFLAEFQIFATLSLSVNLPSLWRKYGCQSQKNRTRVETTAY
jgi:hypothetical protein